MLAISRIKLFILLIICITIFTGCRSEPPAEEVTGSAEVENEVKNIVSNFLNAEQNNNFSYMNIFLTGEALAESNINHKRKQIQKEYLNIELDEKIITSDLAMVYADITVKFNEPLFYDRYATNFYLINDNGRWLIYKVETVALERPELSPGELPASTQKLLEKYLSLPYELKKYNELQYRAGQALNISSLAQMNLYQQKPADITSKGFVVEDIVCLGYSERYCIAKVTYQGGNNDIFVTAIVDLVDVSGKWKINRLDITSQKRGEG